MTCRIERPDTRQHLTEFAEPTKETACVYGGVHTRLLCLAGLVPRQHTTGGKPRLGKISKMGQRDLRRLLITGAMTVVRHVGPTRRGQADPWLARMLARKPRMLVAVALANRMARIVWALTTKREIYRAPALEAA